MRAGHWGALASPFLRRGDRKLSITAVTRMIETDRRAPASWFLIQHRSSNWVEEEYGDHLQHGEVVVCYLCTPIMRWLASAPAATGVEAVV